MFFVLNAGAVVSKHKYLDAAKKAARRKAVWWSKHGTRPVTITVQKLDKPSSWHTGDAPGVRYHIEAPLYHEWVVVGSGPEAKNEKH